MAKVKIEDVVDHLSSEFRKALADTIGTVAPGAAYDEREAFRVFRRAVYHHCSIWEDVPDRFIQK